MWQSLRPPDYSITDDCYFEIANNTSVGSCQHSVRERMNPNTWLHAMIIYAIEWAKSKFVLLSPSHRLYQYINNLLIITAMQAMLWWLTINLLRELCLNMNGCTLDWRNSCHYGRINTYMHRKHYLLIMFTLIGNNKLFILHHLLPVLTHSVTLPKQPWYNCNPMLQLSTVASVWLINVDDIPEHTNCYII